MPRDPIQFYADLEYSNGSVVERVSAEWSTSDPAVATVNQSGLMTTRQFGVFDLIASAEGLTARLDGLRVALASVGLYLVEPGGFYSDDDGAITVGESAQVRAGLEYSDGSIREDVAEWSTSDPVVATVSESGLVTARQIGVFDLIVRAEGFTDRINGVRVVPAAPLRPVDPQFNDLFWSQLVFNQFDAPGLRYRSAVLETPCLNVYIRLGDSTGQRRIVPDAFRDHITQAVPQLSRQLTGQPYRCRIEAGIADRTEKGWITVRFLTDGNREGGSSSGLGSASVGSNPGNIWIWLGLAERDGGAGFPVTFAHEFGHAMGFLHVAETAGMPKPLMTRGSHFSDPATFNATEQYHAQLAYEVGRGQWYCGWPYQESCFTPRRFDHGAAWVPPFIVID